MFLSVAVPPGFTIRNKDRLAVRYNGRARRNLHAVLLPDRDGKPFRCAAPEMYFKRERRRLAPPGGSLGTPFALLLLHQCLCRMYDIIG